MIQMDYAIEIQKDNPKKAGTKSADLYDQYKGAGTVKEMLSLGGRRGDVSYDIAHGWITRVPAAPPPFRASSRTHRRRRFPDAELNRRFCGADAKEEEEAPPRPEDQLYAAAKKLPPPPSDADEDVEAWVMPDIEAISYGRKVGYQVREADDIPPEIFAVSATGVRGGNKANVSERVMEFMITEGIWDGE